MSCQFGRCRCLFPGDGGGVLGKICLVHLNEKAMHTVCSWYLYSSCLEKREKNVSQLCPITGNNQICILVSLFKGHTSIPWIQISMEKAYQSNFAQPSSYPPNQTGMKQTMLKAISPPSLWPMREWWGTIAQYSRQQYPERLTLHLSYCEL